MHHKYVNTKSITRFHHFHFFILNHSLKTERKTQRKLRMIMESRGSRELFKSILIMAGIPLAFSVACTLFARNNDKNVSSLKDQIHESDSLCGDDHDDENHLKEQLFALRSKIKELQDLEREIEVRFFRFIDLKDQEYVLMEVQNTLGMEKERAEFLERELMLTEVENKKFDEMVVEYQKALGELESSRLENGLLQRKVKKLLKKTRESLRIIRKQNLKIEVQEAQMSSIDIEFKRKEIVIKGYEREAEGMQALISRLSVEKNDVLNKLETTENKLASKVEAERTLMENYNQVVKELQNLQKDREGELKELIYLRWCHACLRQELARRNQPEQEIKSEDKMSDDEPESGLRGNAAPEEWAGHELDNTSVVHHEEPFLGPSQQHTKRRSLLRKFKKWVEGNEKNHEAKCFQTRSVVDEDERQQSDGRKSFSSV